MKDKILDPRLLTLFGNRIICGLCRATIETFGDKCAVPVEVQCEGFKTIQDGLAKLSPTVKK